MSCKLAIASRSLVSQNNNGWFTVKSLDDSSSTVKKIYLVEDVVQENLVYDLQIDIKRYFGAKPQKLT